MLGLLTSASEIVRQYLARLFNALASLSAGTVISCCAKKSLDQSLPLSLLAVQSPKLLINTPKLQTSVKLKNKKEELRKSFPMNGYILGLCSFHGIKS